MIFEDNKIEKEKKWVFKLLPKIKNINTVCSVGSDQTRVQILFLLQRHEELCVTNLANILNVSISAISHQLRSMEKAHLVIKTKMGQIVCYSINPKSKIIEFLNFKNRL